MEQAVTQGWTQAEALFSCSEPLCGDESNGRQQQQKELEPCPNKEQNNKKLFPIFTVPSNGLNNNKNPVTEKNPAKSKSNFNFKERTKNFYIQLKRHWFDPLK